MEKKRICSASPEETEAAGQSLGNTLPAGAVVALFGEIGAGKTAFVRGFARGMGVSGRVTSPTFAIVNEYGAGMRRLCHFDLYRLSSADELYEIGWEDYLSSGATCIVEWSEVLEGHLPENAVVVKIEKTGETCRVIEVEEERP